MEKRLRSHGHTEDRQPRGDHALEHFTAILSHELLADRGTWRCRGSHAALWNGMLAKIEHKAWPMTPGYTRPKLDAWKRWKVSRW